MPDPEPRIPRSGVWSYRVGGHVSIAGAERDYGVVVRYLGGVNPIVRLPGDYELDIAATGRLRASLATAGDGPAASDPAGA